MWGWTVIIVIQYNITGVSIGHTLWYIYTTRLVSLIISKNTQFQAVGELLITEKQNIALCEAD